MNQNFLSSFTPSLMSSETLEAIFVQRHELVENLIESVSDSVSTKNKPFHLLIGMRGIGKTHTIALIYHRLKAETDLQDKLLIAWLKEEEWGVSSLLDLLLRIFQALAIEYPIEYQKFLQSKVESLYDLSSNKATSQAEKILKEFVKDKKILLLAENLDLIFKGLGNIGQEQFYAYLQNNDFIKIIATSQSLFADVIKKKSPFYEFFYTQDLDKLTITEATALLTKIAQLQENTELETFIKSPIGKDRVEAIHHLAGGNHRVYIIFSQFLTRDSLDELVQPVMQTLDELTPYYQAKMQWLSPQQRKIVELLCDRRNAIPVKEIAQRCFITHQTASSQLKDLREKGYVTAEYIGRESFYELQEPLMRICLEVKKQRGEPIKLFIDFLRIWYTKRELKERLQILPEDCLEREYINHALAAKAEFMSVDSNHKFAATKNLVNRDTEKVITGNIEIDYDKALAINPDNDYAWNNRGIALKNLGKFEEAIASYDKALAINPDNDYAWNNRGIALNNLGKFEEAIASYDKALAINSDKDSAWYNRGIALNNLGKLEEAIASYDKAIIINPGYKFSHFNRIEGLLKSNRWEEGFKDLDDTLNRFANTEEPKTGDTIEYIKIIWESTTDITIWKSRLKTLVEIYDKHQVVAVLSKGIVDNIPNLMSEMVSDKAARAWLEIWQEIVGDKPELAIALRFLKTAVEYKETKGNRKVLLQLAKEERELLEPLLKNS